MIAGGLPVDMKIPSIAFASTLALLLLAPGCTISVDDGGGDGDAPVKSESKSVDRGKAESVRAVLRMDAGQLKLAGGAAQLLQADFRTTHVPLVSYDGSGVRGLLEIKGTKKGRWKRGGDNSWKLKMDSKTPIDLEVHLGAGETDLDLSQIALRSLEVHMGVGELKLNLDGVYDRDVNVDVHGGVGRAEIHLPRKMGAQVDAKGGIGSVKARGLKQDGSLYTNAAYEKSSRQVRCTVRGGVGEIELIGDE